MPAVGAAIAAASAAISGTVATLTATFAGKLLLNVAIQAGISALSRAVLPKPKTRRRKIGIQTSVSTTGGTEPEAFILGYYATAGHHVVPPYTHGEDNRYLQYVLEVSSVPGVSLRRVMVDEAWHTPSATIHPDFGAELPDLSRDGEARAWVKFYDGSQTVADPFLVSQYGSHPDRPWTSAHVGTGIAYAIVTFRFTREIFSSLPVVRFELDGIPLYDPRKDTTAGGSGAHRWNDRATWEPTTNPAVMVYNIKRGISVGVHTWGGSVPEADLPFDNWVTAMNACDALIGDRPRYRAGLEVFATEEPAEIVEELLRACNGAPSEFGGVFRVRVGAPVSPVYFLTDDDIVISSDQDFEPFPSADQAVNYLTASYPEPASLWQAREAEPYSEAAWEVEDGRRLSEDLALVAVPYGEQVAQLLSEYAQDNRRQRVHRLVLPPDAAILEPLDTLSWTSERNGYSSKLFEVLEVVDQPLTLLQEVFIREVDPSDYDWTAGDDPAAPSNVTALTPPAAQAVAGWAVAAVSASDDGGAPRRPGIRMTWTATAAADAATVKWEVRLASSQVVVASGVAARDLGEALVWEGLLAATAYEARGKYEADRPTDWTAWTAVTTPDVRLSTFDLGAELQDLFGNLLGPEYVFDGADLSEVILDVQAAITGLTSTASALAETVTEEVRADLDQTIADLGVTSTTVGAVTGRVDDIENFTLSPTSGLAQKIALIELEFDAGEAGTYAASVQSALSGKVSAAGAVAAVTSEVSASFGSLTALASASQIAKATRDQLLSGYIWRVNGGSIELVSITDVDANGVAGATTVTTKIDSDYVQITGIAQIDTAVIENLVAADAFIDNLYVETFNLAGNSVTIPAANTGAVKAGNGNWQQLAIDTVSMPYGGHLLILWNIQHGYSGVQDWGFRIVLNATTLLSRSGMTFGNDYPSGAFLVENVVPGNKVVQLEWLGANGSITGRGTVILQAVMA